MPPRGCGCQRCFDEPRQYGVCEVPPADAEEGVTVAGAYYQGGMHEELAIGAEGRRQMATEEEIERIVDAGEPGVLAAVEAYEQVEETYLTAVAAATPEPAYVLSTSASISATADAPADRPLR